MYSVIIATYNRADTLARTLERYFAQEAANLVPHELVVVNNNSTDHTAEVIADFADEYSLVPVFEEKQGLSHARNAGIAAASGDVLVFLDDDVLVDKHWLIHLARCFQQTDADAVGGRSFLMIEGDIPPWFGPDFRTLLSEVQLGYQRRDAGDGRRLFGLNFAVKREALERVGGFDAGLGRKGGGLLAGEERLLLRRIHDSGGKLMYEPRAVVGHLIGPDRLQWRYFVKLAYGIGSSRAQIDADRRVIWRVWCFVDTAWKFAAYSLTLPLARLFGRNHYRYRQVLYRWLRMRALLPQRWRMIRESS